MKRMINWLVLIIILLLLPVMLFAQVAEDGGSMVQAIITALTPIAVLIGAQIVKIIKPKIPGHYLLIWIGLLSTAVTFATQWTSLVDIHWAWQILAGTWSVTIHQIYKQFTERN